MSTIKEKLPSEFKDEMQEILGDEYSLFLDSYDSEKTNGIRINTMKTTVSDISKLGLFSIDYEEDVIKWCKEGFYISNNQYPGKNPLHDAGAYYIQEPSAMSVVGSTEIKEGDVVLDMCAAPGGKSTYILSKLNNTGILVSNEIDPIRVRALGENLERFGAVRSIITNTDSTSLLKYFNSYFDKVFIDAPCSGQGMFRKDEYAIEDWSTDKVLECESIQKRLIRDGYDMLKEDGMLIYSTCTFSKKENEDVITDFLNEYSDAELLDMERLWPHKDRGEGHFCARIIKGSSNNSCMEDTLSDSKITIKNKNKKKKKYSKRNMLDNNELSLLNSFIDSNYENKSLFVDEKLELIKRDSLVYISPKISVDIDGLKVMRNGICIGELKKNRFEPSHSLAMATSKEDVKSYINLSYDGEIIKRYMFGEEIDINRLEMNEYISEDRDGWILVCVEGVSLGWGKKIGNTIKNKFPKGLRRSV